MNEMFFCLVGDQVIHCVFTLVFCFSTKPFVCLCIPWFTPEHAFCFYTAQSEQHPNGKIVRLKWDEVRRCEGAAGTMGCGCAWLRNKQMEAGRV